MRKSLLVGFATLLLMTVTSARAGQITNLQLYDGSATPTATITFTSAGGTGSTMEFVYADPQVSGGTTAPVYYCVDLWHDNSNGQTYTFTPVSGIAFSDSTFTDVDNRIGWLLSQDQSTPDARAAVQLAIWYTIDNTGFSMTAGDSAITTDFNSLITFAGYDASDNYSADFWQAAHDSTNTLYQDLVSAPPGGVVTVSSVPEPSSLVLSSISVLFLAALTCWRRLH